MTDKNSPSRYIIIPARRNSSRFNGKPLAEINGVPMIAHAAKLATESALASVVVVVSDDCEILETAKKVGNVMPVHGEGEFANGTERVARFARQLERDATICILQCDEVTIAGRDLDLAMALAERNYQAMLTVASRKPSREVGDDDVMLDLDSCGRVTRFARGDDSAAHHHVGVYVAGNALLQRYAELEPSPAETTERLEQLRWSHHGIAINCLTLPIDTESVNRPEDIYKVERLMASRNRG